MRILPVLILALGMHLATATARAQTYNPRYPVCVQIFGPFGHFDCSYTSLAQCNLNVAAQAAQCVLIPITRGGVLPIRRTITGGTVTFGEWRLDRRVDDELQRRIVIGLEARIFEMQPALRRMIEDLPA